MDGRALVCVAGMRDDLHKHTDEDATEDIAALVAFVPLRRKLLRCIANLRQQAIDAASAEKTDPVSIEIQRSLDELNASMHALAATLARESATASGKPPPSLLVSDPKPQRESLATSSTTAPSATAPSSAVHPAETNAVVNATAVAAEVPEAKADDNDVLNVSLSVRLSKKTDDAQSAAVSEQQVAPSGRPEALPTDPATSSEEIDLLPPTAAPIDTAAAAPVAGDEMLAVQDKIPSSGAMPHTETVEVAVVSEGAASVSGGTEALSPAEVHQSAVASTLETPTTPDAVREESSASSRQSGRQEAAAAVAEEAVSEAVDEVIAWFNEKLDGLDAMDWVYSPVAPAADCVSPQLHVTPGECVHAQVSDPPGDEGVSGPSGEGTGADSRGAGEAGENLDEGFKDKAAEVEDVAGSGETAETAGLDMCAADVDPEVKSWLQEALANILADTAPAEVADIQERHAEEMSACKSAQNGLAGEQAAALEHGAGRAGETDASPATIAAEGKEVKPATESADGTDDPSLEVAQTAAESQAPAGEHSATSAQGEGLVADVQVADADGGDPSAEPESS